MNKSRILNILSVLVYTLVFIWSYIVWLAPVWNYVGFFYSPLSFFYFFTTIFFCVLPSFWIPISVTRPSMIIYWVLYLMTFIPMIVGVTLSSSFKDQQIYLFNLVLTISFFFTGFGYKFKMLNFKFSPISRGTFWVIFSFFFLLFFAYILFIFRGNLRLVSPFDVDLYEVRFDGNDILAGTLVGYPIQWLSGAFLPFLLGYGIIQKKYTLVIIAIFGQIILYMTQANKSFILSIIFMCFFFFLSKKTKKIGIVLSLILSLTILLLISSQNYLNEDYQILFFGITSLFMLRTLAISTVNIINYLSFFQNKQYTYYSHIKIIGQFIDYPYGNLSLGQVIGNEMSGNTNSNYNANFYITDGLAALGFPGLIFIGILSGALLYLIDSISSKHNILFTTILFSYSAINFMNISIFTSFLSGGLLFIIIFLFLYKPNAPLLK